MVVTIKRWRVSKVRLDDLRSAAGAGESAGAAEILDGLRKSLGPLGPRIQFFFPPAPPRVEHGVPERSLVTVGIEVESFDVRAPGIPFAGVIHADPLDSLDLAREEGALRAELERIGLRAEVDEMEWRFSYEVKEG